MSPAPLTPGRSRRSFRNSSSSASSSSGGTSSSLARAAVSSDMDFLLPVISLWCLGEQAIVRRNHARVADDGLGDVVRNALSEWIELPTACAAYEGVAQALPGSHRLQHLFGVL